MNIATGKYMQQLGSYKTRDLFYVSIKNYLSVEQGSLESGIAESRFPHILRFIRLWTEVGMLLRRKKKQEEQT